MPTFIITVNEWLDEDHSEMSENIEIETEFSQKRIVKEQLGGGLQTRNIKLMLLKEFMIKCLLKTISKII